MKSLRRDVDVIQTVDECGGRAHGRRSFEDLHHTIAPVDGSDRIRDLETWDRGVVIPEDFEQQPVQRGSEERRIAWRDQHEVASGRPEPLVEPLDRPAALAHIVDEDNAREDRSNLRSAFRTTHGHDRLIGEGCALGTTGMRDFTMKGIHLCTVRLNLLPLNTMGPLDIGILEDVGRLRSVSSKDLRALGRLPYPMLRRRGDPGFHRISWDEALGIAARRIRTAPPHRIAFFVTSRGMTNESYYVANKVARFLGTNHIDNSSRPCHSPSTTGLKDTIGVAASTCSYTDWIGSDLIVFFGSDVPNNQPVTTKYLYYAKKQGTKIAVVNPMREPGLERYWVPSVPDS